MTAGRQLEALRLDDLCYNRIRSGKEIRDVSERTDFVCVCVCVCNKIFTISQVTTSIRPIWATQNTLKRNSLQVELNVQYHQHQTYQWPPIQLVVFASCLNVNRLPFKWPLPKKLPLCPVIHSLGSSWVYGSLINSSWFVSKPISANLNA
jgi:hypothetical protein